MVFEQNRMYGYVNEHRKWFFHFWRLRLKIGIYSA